MVPNSLFLGDPPTVLFDPDVPEWVRAVPGAEKCIPGALLMAVGDYAAAPVTRFGTPVVLLPAVELLWPLQLFARGQIQFLHTVDEARYSAGSQTDPRPGARS